MLAASIIIAVVVLDQLTKYWIMANFVEFQTQEIISGVFSLTYLTNKGAAFGFLSGDHGAWRHAFFIGIAVLAMIIMLLFLRQMHKEGKWSVTAIGLIFGGAAGNLIDRVRFGAVVDFLDFYWKTHHWPAFNVADSAITVGVGIFLLVNFLRPHTVEQ